MVELRREAAVEGDENMLHDMLLLLIGAAMGYMICALCMMGRDS